MKMQVRSPSRFALRSAPDLAVGEIHCEQGRDVVAWARELVQLRLPPTDWEAAVFAVRCNAGLIAQDGDGDIIVVTSPRHATGLAKMLFGLIPETRRVITGWAKSVGIDLAKPATWALDSWEPEELVWVRRINDPSGPILEIGAGCWEMTHEDVISSRPCRVHFGYNSVVEL